MGNKAKQFIALAAAVAVVLGFQNCSKGFKASQETFQSSQCAAKAREKAASLPLDAEALECENPDNYECDVRNFGEELEDSSAEERICINGTSLCVTATIRNYKTDAEFQRSEEYQRQEIRCFHRHLYKGVALLQAESDSLESALNGAIAACSEVGK